MTRQQNIDFTLLSQHIKAWGKALGFDDVAITTPDLEQASQRLQQWLEQKFHGSMDYMAKHSDLRANPGKLVPGTVRIIMVRLDYLPDRPRLQETLQDHHLAYISRYALGADYHKVMRRRLQKLADKISQQVGSFGYRAFTDSAPVLEKALAAKAGLGWMGKNTLIINRRAGSWFFLGTLFTDLPLVADPATSAHCGSCQACIEICPTKAIVAPYVLDARRCISYLTIENKGSIPVAFREAIGNRIFGCDDCQIICPWNKFAKTTREARFFPRHQLDHATLLSLFAWDEATFLQRTQGSAIRRAGYLGWLRNIAVALGNAPPHPQVLIALQQRRQLGNPMLNEHLDWAIKRQKGRIKAETNRDSI